ncbi:MAG: hypothetical protein R2731_02320 [Nocardioides sp.]
MHVVTTVLTWVWVLFAVPMSVYFLLFNWRVGTVTTYSSGLLGDSATEREGTWRDLLAQKAVAIVFLAVSYLLLAQYFGGWRPTLGR